MRNKFLFCVLLIISGLFTADAQVQVTFKIGKLPVANDAGGIFLAGNFNGWAPAHADWRLLKNDQGVYSTTKTLPAGRYELKATRGSWERVECSADGQGIGNREYVINTDTTIIIDIAAWQDGFAVKEKQHTASANVHLLAEKFDMPQLGTSRRIWIYLPPQYAAGKTKYPVIYMHDGQNLFDDYTAGYGEWGIDEIMDKLPDARQSIIVGIDHGGDQRISEYTPYKSEFSQIALGPRYVNFLVKTLKPYIDKNYRTLKDVKHTAIAGSSMGGLISLYAVMEFPKVFGTAGVFSPAIWVSGGIMARASKAILKNYNRFYFVCGDAEDENMVINMQKMADLLKGAGLTSNQLSVIVLKGEKHNEKQWNKSFPGFYEWVVGD